MIDLHSDILPGLDDRPSTMPGAVQMAEVAVAAGTRTIVATPHVNLVYDVSPEEIEVAVAELNAELARREIGLNVLAGAEVAHWRLADLDDATLARLRLGDGPYLLVECPITSVLGPFEDLVIGLHVRGFGIVLAPSGALALVPEGSRPGRPPRAERDAHVAHCRLTGRTVRPFRDQVCGSAVPGRARPRFRVGRARSRGAPPRPDGRVPPS